MTIFIATFRIWILNRSKAVQIKRVNEENRDLKKYFSLSSILFYLLFTLVFFILGITIAEISGAAEGQGLAGSAIVLGYGTMVGLFAFIAAVLSVRFISKKRIIQLNKIFGILFLILALYFVYQYKSGSRPPERAILLIP